VDISVIIPAYNRAHLIRATLQSILSQTHPAAEIIVVDDGSMDDTGRVVGEFGDSVKYVRIANSGEHIARTSSSFATVRGRTCRNSRKRHPDSGSRSEKNWRAICGCTASRSSNG